LPDLESLAWKKQWIENWHFTPEHKPRPIRRQWLRLGNQFLANDLINAIENDREPLTSGTSARLVTEIVQGVYASHLQQGQRISIPLRDRQHPLLG